MNTGRKETRIMYLDLLRIVSTFSMMFLHAASSQWYEVSVKSFEWQMFNIYDGMVRFCVPVFIMISGVFFLNPERSCSLKNLFHKNILKIIKAFVFWSFCYSLLKNLRHFRSLTLESVKGFMQDFILGHYHLWFLFMLAGLYLCVPLLRKICESKELMRYYLSLSFIFGYLMNLFLMIPGINNILTRLLSQANLSFFLGYTGYFMLGYYLHSNKIHPSVRKCIYILGLLSVTVTILLSAYLSVRAGSPNSRLYDFLLPNTCFAAAAVFLFFQETMSKIQLSQASVQKILLLSELSFGMYLIHDFFNIFFFKILKITTLSFHAGFSVPVFAVLVYLLSFLTIYVFRKIPYLGKHVI